MATYWRVQQTQSDRFPYRITLESDDDGIILALRTKDRWPGPQGHVFCLREQEPPEEALEELEYVAVVSLSRFGKKLSLVLDRRKRRRCDFLFLTKPYKNKPGHYEQIFFRTQGAVRAHKTRGRTQLFGDSPITALIDRAERYPWRFPGAETRRESLPAGDYALEDDGQIQALVERKTFDNLLSDFGQIQILHQQLAELATYPHPSLVVEAPYGDFLDPQRVAPWSAAHSARVVAEIQAMHPGLPVIFAGNRKQANRWGEGATAGAGHAQRYLRSRNSWGVSAGTGEPSKSLMFRVTMQSQAARSAAAATTASSKSCQPRARARSSSFRPIAHMFRWWRSQDRARSAEARSA